MRIEFSEKFEEVPRKLLNITRKDVVRAITNPLKKQVIDMGDLKVLLFLQKDRGTDTYLLLIGFLKGNIIEIDQGCFRILPELILKARSSEPILLLQQLALNFGFPLTIGNRVEKFLFRKTFVFPVNTKTNFFGIIPVKPGDHILVSMFAKQKYAIINEKKMSILECALFFLIELNSYIAWLDSKTNVQVSVQSYDVFISYKQSTGKGFARYLKDSLTDEGYRVFLDTIDIPKEFEGTDRWFLIRDEAIRNSRRFLLIVTISIESSEEVAKELFLARNIPKMKFIYARHEELSSPEIQIEFNNELIDLSEGNQVTFSTDDDLARKILKILKEDEKLRSFE